MRKIMKRKIIWGNPSIKAVCKKCSAPCCQVSTVILDKEKAERKLKNFKGKYTYQNTGKYPEKVPVLKKNPDGTCIFFDKKNKLCTIYENRPASCENFFCGRGTENNRWWKDLIRMKKNALRNKESRSH